jgi:hypothetical protein
MLDMQRVRMRQFREIRQLREEAWEAWKKSKEPEKEVTQEERKAGKGKGASSSRASVKTRNTSGQAKFLSVIKDLISLEADLIGTKVPRIISCDEDTPAQLLGGIIKIPAYDDEKPGKQ